MYAQQCAPGLLELCAQFTIFRGQRINRVPRR